MNLSPLLEKGVKCADVGCGTGLFSISLASRFPNSTVRGFDVDNNSIERAKKNLEAAGAKNASFEVRSLYELDKFDELFDLIFAFDMIHDLNDPVLGLQAIRKSLKPGGMLVMMEPKVAEKFEDSLTPETAGSLSNLDAIRLTES